MSDIFPSELSLEDVQVRIRSSGGNPNIGKTHQVVLKNGPRTYRVATIFEIMDPAKGILHHLSLRLDSFDKTKAGWKIKPDKLIRLEGEDPDEIGALEAFLSTALANKSTAATGSFHLVPDAKFRFLEDLAQALPKLPGPRKLQLLRQLLDSLDASGSDANQVVEALTTATPETVKNLSVAVRYVQYRAAYEELERLVSIKNGPESRLQQHLQSNPWIFGSEYSELLDRRRWARDDNLDFMLRRTVDGYLEIIEIKTPFEEPLFRFDANHDSHYPSSKLSQSLGQVIRYIEEIERSRNSIIAGDNVDPLKIRARVVLGRDGDNAQKAALRSFNAHLHRIEILTFDQLLRIGQRTIEIFRESITSTNVVPEDADDDIPF
ncbi:MAG: Shedu anti-phage system protein SduA domain-containing protein [Pseudomonadota bacterium]